MAINVKGVWLSMKYEIPEMLATAGCGAIVNSSSIVGLIGFPKAVALEYAQQTLALMP